MVTPETYNCIKCNTPYNAENISETKINPDEIKAAVEKVNDAIDLASTNIKNVLEPITDNAKTAYVMDETKTIVKSIEGAYENANNKLNNVKSQIESEDLYNKAVIKHDALQGDANTTAKQKAEACAASHKSETEESQG